MEQIFSYVSKSQYKPHLKIANDLLQFLHKELKIYFREKYKTKFTFEHRMIGSGSKKLIMKKIDGNQGFDFDYNVVINNFDKLPVKAQDCIRNIFISAIQNILGDVPCEIGINNSTSVITVKFYNGNKTETIFGIDIAIMKKDNDGNLFIWKFNDNKQNLIWNQRQSLQELDGKVKLLRKLQLWGDVRNRYEVLKNKNAYEISFALFIQTISDIYNKHF